MFYCKRDYLVGPGYCKRTCPLRMQVFLDSSSEVYNIYVGMYVKGISDQNTRIYASSLNNVIITLISYNLTEIQCICKLDFGKVFMKRTVFKIFQKFGCRKRS